MDVKLTIAKWINRTLGDDWGGNHSPPGSDQRLEFGEIDPGTGKPSNLATTYNNDGCEVWLWWAGSWAAFYREKDARRLAWFILWDWWAVGTWFGLKRWIWYKALGVIVESYKQYRPINPDPDPSAR
jgi:hypothetical protein